jgi:hypothetical protein
MGDVGELNWLMFEEGFCVGYLVVGGGEETVVLTVVLGT